MSSWGYDCTVCGHRTQEACVWDSRAICRDCTFRSLGDCPICGTEIRGVVTPLSNDRTHFSVEHTCNIANGGAR